MKKIIGRGAEAVLYHKDGHLIKQRVTKSYRIPEIDNKIRKLRTRAENSLLEKVSKLINVPKVIDYSDTEMTIDMEFIDGLKLSEQLDKLETKKREHVCKLIGESVVNLHDNDIIHGDLTTSNMILKEDKLYFIDFGLGFVSKRDEDKAVDLHLLKQALESKHYKHYEDSFQFVLEGYKRCKFYKEVISRLNKVEKRGRYKAKEFQG